MHTTNAFCLISGVQNFLVVSIIDIHPFLDKLPFLANSYKIAAKTVNLIGYGANKYLNYLLTLARPLLNQNRLKNE